MVYFKPSKYISLLIVCRIVRAQMLSFEAIENIEADKACRRDWGERFWATQFWPHIRCEMMWIDTVSINSTYYKLCVYIYIYIYTYMMYEYMYIFSHMMYEYMYIFFAYTYPYKTDIEYHIWSGISSMTRFPKKFWWKLAVPPLVWWSSAPNKYGAGEIPCECVLYMGKPSK